MRALFMAGFGLAALSACVQAPESGQTATAPMEAAMGQTTVLGSLTYRQRIALPVTAMATIEIYQDGKADEGGEPVAEQTFALNGRQVPIPFEVVFEREDPSAIYTLRAHIRSADGELLWQSKPVQSFASDGASENLGMVMMVPAGQSRVSQADLTGKEWMVASLDGTPVLTASPVTMNFGDDGRLSGNASCNAYTGSYKINDSALYVGPLALTRKACMGDAMAQETAFVQLLEAVSEMQIDETGTLTISGEAGETLTAR